VVYGEFWLNGKYIPPIFFEIKDPGIEERPFFAGHKIEKKSRIRDARESPQ
jgi:hypothetical protein